MTETEDTLSLSGSLVRVFFGISGVFVLIVLLSAAQFLGAVTNRQLAAANVSSASVTLISTETQHARQPSLIVHQGLTGGSACLSYSPAVAKLTGTVTPKTFPGLPHFESVEDGDEAENVWIVELSAPTCTNEQQVEDQTTDANADVRENREVLSRKVTVTGTWEHAFTAHNHTAVMSSVSSIDQ
jgi:hypothetical protein